MKLYKYSLFLLTILLCVACFEDETTEATRPLSEITIEKIMVGDDCIDSVCNIGKNEVLKFVPIVSQTNEEKLLTYTWEVDLKVCSHDTEYEFVGKDLGTFKCRLIVENSDGKSFYPFIINVNSEYEEGITVLSRDAEGRSMLSFMQTPMNPGEEAVFTKGDCFEVNNPDINFASNPTDIIHGNEFLVISCMGGDTGEDVPTIYYLNEKTLVVENMVEVPEYPDFKPVKLLLPKVMTDGIYPVLCKDGNVYEFSPSEAVVQRPTKLQSNYAQSTIVINDGYYYDILLWDNRLKALARMYYGYGPFYCSTEYNYMYTDTMTVEQFQEKNYFKDQKDFVCMVRVNMTKEQQKTETDETIVITAGGINWNYLRLYTGFWLEGTAESTYLADNGGFSIAGIPVNLNDKTPVIANRTYKTMFFADGNKIRCWHYMTDRIDLNKVLQTVGTESAVITGFEISSDHKKTYVAFYEPEQEGLNGSVWVIDTDKGTVLEKYDNVCYQPVKILYKYK